MNIKTINTTQKIDSLQILRGYAAVLVGVSHIWNDGWLPGTLVELGGFGVDVFFVLSGFIMCLTVRLNLNTKLENATYFIKKRIVRIFPIYIICALPLLLFNTYAEGVKSPYFYIGNILLLPSFTNNPSYYLTLGPGWSLVYEMLFYYVFAGIMLVTANKNKLLSSLALLLTGLVIVVRTMGLQGPQLGWVNLNYIIGDTMLINFAFGIVVYYIYEACKDKIKLSLGFSIGWLLLWSFIASVFIYFDFSRFVAYGIPAFFITSAFTLTNNNSIKGKWMNKAIFIGDASYSIYLTHIYFSFFKPKILLLGDYLSISADLYRNLVGITSLILAVVSGCLFYLWVEKPIINYFSKRMKASKTPKRIAIT